MIWVETPSNPTLKVSDLRAIANVAHDNNRKIVFAVDNTLLTSYYQRPLEFGVDVVMYSLTKYMNGHNDVLMGALVCNNEELFNELKYIQTIYGLVPCAFNCYLVTRALKTLALRMQQHFKNGVAVAKYLESNPNVLSVQHPSLKTHPQHELAQKQSTGQCGLLAFRLKGSIREVKIFIRNLRLIISSASFGTCDSFISLP